MAQAIGWGALPIGVSLRGLQGEIDKKLRKPLEKASREAGEAASKNLTKAAKQAADAVEHAKQREKKAIESVAKAEDKLEAKRTAQESKLKAIESAEKKLRSAQEQRLQKVSKAESDYDALRQSGKATTRELEVAEAKLAQARLDADARVIDRENALEAARRRSESAASQVASAEESLAAAKKRAADASDAVVAKTAQQDKAQADLNARAKEGTWLLDKLGVELSDVDDAMERAASSTKGFAGHLWDTSKKIGTLAAGMAGVAGVAGTLQKGFAKVTSIEDTTQSLGILMGDAANAQSLMQDLQETNQNTPYAFDAWAGAGKKLVAFGVEAEEVSRTVTALGEAASASGKGEDALNSMSEAFGQAAAAGKLSMDTLNRLSDGGVQGLKILANEAGITTEEMQKRISSGKVSAVEGIQVLTDGILEGSEGVNGAVESMSGVMGEMAETTSGRLTNMQAAFNNLAAEIFKQINPLINVVAEKVTAWTYDFIGVLRDDLIPAIQSFNAWVKENAAVLGAMAGSIGIAVGALKLMKLHQDIVMAGGFLKYLLSFDKLTLAAARAQKVLNFAMSKNPAALLIKGFVLLSTGLAVFFTKTEAGRKAWADFTEAFAERWDQAVGRFKGGLDTLFGFFSQAKDVAAEVKSILFDGDFTGRTKLFGLADESSPAVAFLLTIRDLAISIGDSLKSAFGSVKDIVVDLGKALGGAVVDVLKGLFGLLQDLWPVLAAVGKIVGGVLAGAFLVAVKGVELFAGALSGVMKALVWLTEKALAPFLAFVGKFVGAFLNDIVPALTWFGDIIGTVVGGAFQLLGSVISGTWKKVIKPTFNALVTVGKWMVQILGTVVISPILIAWNLLSEGIQWAWENRIKPTFGFMANVGTWLWENALQPAFEGIKWAFEKLGEGMQWVFDNLIKPVFDVFAWAAEQVWEGAQVVFEGIRFAFQLAGAGLRWVYDNVIQPVWDDFTLGLTILRDYVVAPVLDFIGRKWEEMSIVLDVVKTFIVDKVFAGLRDGLDAVKDGFEYTVDAIGRLWNGIKAKTAKPVQWVVDVVFNSGIRKAWNAVAPLTGLDKMDEIHVADLGNYASGGVLPGYTPGRDPYTFVEPSTGMRIGLSGGESILRPEATRALGSDWVDGVNRAARSGGQQAVERTLTHSHFASGGIIDLGNFANGGFTNLAGGLTAVQQSMGEFVGRFFPGAFNLTSATRPGAADFHGAGLATDWQAKDGQFQSQMPTPYSKALARAIYTNFRNSTELIHWPLDGWVNLKNGAHLDYGPATNAGHGNHVHWAIRSPLRFDGDDIVLDDVSGISSDTFSWNPINMVKRLWDGAIEKIGQFGDAAKHGLFGELPGAMAKAMIESAWNFVSSKANKGGADDTGAYHGAVGAGVEQWRPMVEAVLRDKGFPETLADTVLRRMNQESGGNVRALNDWDVNAVNGTPSKGLMQVIDPTFAAHKDPGYDDIWDPESNLRASMNYAISRYGSLPAAYNRPGGYANGGVLPGFTPGVDVHQFYSPTAGWLGLSGGESIMVPEWTAMQGGPAAVERMNRAARAGRSSSARGQAFADGGTFWGPIGARQRGAVQGAVAALERLTQQLIETGSVGDLGAEFSAALQPIRQELQVIADASTLEGVAARSAVSQGGQVAGMLGFKGVETIVSSLIDAEKSLIASREGHASRLAEIKQREEELAELRKKLVEIEETNVEEDKKDARKLADAEKAYAKAQADAGKSAEKSAEQVAKAAESAEKATTSSSKKSSDSAEKAAEKSEKAAEKVEKAQAKASESAEKSADKVESAQEKLDRAREDAEENRQKREEKKQQDIKKTTEDIAKAEADLAKARRESANALDMLIFDVDPSIYQGLMRVSDQINASIPGVVEQLSAIPGAGALAAKALPQVAGGVAQLASLAGPAGVSVGVAIDALKTGITLFKQIGQAVGDFVGRLFDARMKAYQAMGSMFDAIRQLGQLTSDLRFEVVGLMADYEMALIKLTEAQRNQRIVAMQGIQAQLQAQLGLAEAEDALAESREADMQTAKLNYDDLTLAWGDYRHVMVDANGEIIEVNGQVTASNMAAAEAQQYKSQETMALEAERDAARLAVDIAMKQAAEDNLAAQWESTQAALDLRDVTRHLGQATKQLAMMSGGYAEQTKSAMVGKQISELMAEKAKLQGEKGKNWWRLGSWHLSGANKAASKRISQIEDQIAELQAMPEFAGFSEEQQASIDYVMANATRMGALGGAEHIETMLKSSAIGDAQRTLDMYQLKTELAEFDKQQEDLRADIKRKKLERDYMRESGAMGTEIQGMEMMREGYLSKAQMHRAKEGSNARKTLEQLSRTQLVHGAEIRNLSVAPEKTVQMPSDRRAFTADEVEEMLGELDVRVEKLERPQPTAAMVAASRR